MGIRPLTDDDVEVYRSIRLRALTADPDAFASTHEREAEFDDATWRSRIGGFQDRRGQIFVEEFDGATTGVVGIGLTEDPTESVLWGMWIDPGVRGTGVGRRLVDRSLAWARAQGCATVTLWVMRSNDGARRLYARCAFVEVDDVGADAPERCESELRMRRVLR